VRRSDVVVVSTPPSSHAEFVEYCQSAGKRVFCEKPLTPTFNEALSIVNKAEEQHISVRVGHFRRGYPAVVAARSLVATGALGTVRRIQIYEGGRFSWSTVSDYITQDPYGGVLLDTGSHALDQALFAAMLETQVPSVTVVKHQRDKPEPAHEMSARCDLHYNTGSITLDICLSRFELLSNIIRIDFDEGAIILPVGYGSGLIISGKAASTVMSGKLDFMDPKDYLLSYYQRVLMDDGPTECEARSFLGQVKIMESILACDS
jgi:predicted dehydrogenase